MLLRIDRRCEDNWIKVLPVIALIHLLIRVSSRSRFKIVMTEVYTFIYVALHTHIDWLRAYYYRVSVFKRLASVSVASLKSGYKREALKTR